MATTDDTSDDLARRIQSLPSELYAEIFDLTFTSSSTTVKVNSSYKPPSTLCVSRATRTNASSLYYAKFTFEFDAIDICETWVKLKSAEHVSLLNNLRIVWNVQQRYDSLEDESVEALTMDAFGALINMRLEWKNFQNVDLSRGVLHMLVLASGIGLEDFLVDDMGEGLHSCAFISSEEYADQTQLRSGARLLFRICGTEAAFAAL